jgi:hypothetical protein
VRKDGPTTLCLVNNATTLAVTVPRDGLKDCSLHNNAITTISDRSEERLKATTVNASFSAQRSNYSSPQKRRAYGFVQLETDNVTE